jgi:hypothetical protein
VGEQLPEARGVAVTEDRVFAASQDCSHLAGERWRDRAHKIDPAMKTAQPPELNSVVDRVAPQAKGLELCSDYHAVLASGESGDCALGTAATSKNLTLVRWIRTRLRFATHIRDNPTGITRAPARVRFWEALRPEQPETPSPSQ